MNKYITEFVGVFFLVLVTGLALGSGSDLAPIAIGATLMVMAYMGKDISGAHYNPAVTLAWYVRSRISLREAGIYVGVQVLAGLIAALIAGLLIQNPEFVFRIRPSSESLLVQSLLVEILFTFALVLVTLHVQDTEAPANGYYGLAVGAAYMALIFAGQPISGAAFNPALGLGPDLLNGGFLYVWIYLVGPLAGGALAGFVYLVQRPKEDA